MHFINNDEKEKIYSARRRFNTPVIVCLMVLQLCFDENILKDNFLNDASYRATYSSAIFIKLIYKQYSLRN